MFLTSHSRIVQKSNLLPESNWRTSYKKDVSFWYFCFHILLVKYSNSDSSHAELVLESGNIAADAEHIRNLIPGIFLQGWASFVLYFLYTDRWTVILVAVSASFPLVHHVTLLYSVDDPNSPENLPGPDTGWYNNPLLRLTAALSHSSVTSSPTRATCVYSRTLLGNEAARAKSMRHCFSVIGCHNFIKLHRANKASGVWGELELLLVFLALPLFCIPGYTSELPGKKFLRDDIGLWEIWPKNWFPFERWSTKIAVMIKNIIRKLGK